MRPGRSLKMRVLSFLPLLVSVCATAVTSSGDERLSMDTNAYSPSDIIKRDVAIIGGGSSGTYTAVRLRDRGKSVVVIEKRDTLGGHAETWTNPVTGYTVDLGVVVFARVQAVTDYFARFNVSLVPLPSIVTKLEYVDFASGNSVNFTPPSAESFKTALGTYLVQLEKYPDLQDGFNMSYPVAPDLLLSFRDFVEKYQLEALVPQIFASNQGYSPLLDISMLYIFKYLNADQVHSFTESLLTTANHNVQELYEKIESFLGADALVSSKVLAMDRASSPSSPWPVRILVQTPAGRKLVLAKKLVSTPPPLPSQLGGYDLSTREREIFGQFRASGYYSGLLNNTGLNESLFATGPGHPYNVPVLPGPYAMSINQGLTQFYYGSPSVMSEDEVKKDVVGRLRKVQKSRGLSVEGEPEWLAFANHAPFNLMVSNEAISKGFYRDLYSLQGRRNTFYTGAAWHTQDSSVLWKFTDSYLIPAVVAAL
ncbi:amine oxidase, flavin-containing superfamily [Hypoxylon cercidicola]|nr:amine oxidase, flavin-containing superfamily [Hypoxylon cercidicola]